MKRQDRRLSLSRTSVRPFLALFVVTHLAVACGQESSPDPEGRWVGTITTKGNITTVVNENGSVRQGRAQLIEEASIGVESGADEYMLGEVVSVFGTDEHIYIVDEETDLVRRYDHGGVFVDTIGGVGGGPGEYLDPAMVALDSAGRILVFDFETDRIQVYSPDGASLGVWPTPVHTWCCDYLMLLANDSALWMPTRTPGLESHEWIYRIRAFGPNGLISENYTVRAIEVPSSRLSVGDVGDQFFVSVPFTPRSWWTLAGPGLVVAGASDRYRFEVQERGETTLVVEKYWNPVPVEAGHAEWRRQMAISDARRFEPGRNWNGAEIPDHFPAFAGLLPTRSGEIWVPRYLSPLRQSDCVEDPLAEPDGLSAIQGFGNPCWRASWILDAYGRDGRYVGEIDTPQDMDLSPGVTHVFRDRVVSVVEDEGGTTMVKRYRLELPNATGSAQPKR